MAATWDAVPGRSRTVRSTQALTEAAPTLATEGVLIANVDYVVPVLKAPDGQTFTGVGAIRGYLYVPSLGRWTRAPRADDDLADLATMNEGALPAIPIGAQGAGSRFALICDGITLSGGTSVTIEFACHGRSILGDS